MDSYHFRRSSTQCLCHSASVSGLDEELQFHLLELAAAEREIARIDLVAERLADLRDAERHLLARHAEDVVELRENDLRGFGAEIGDAGAVLDRADERLEHQIELARLGELVRAAFGTFRVRAS